MFMDRVDGRFLPKDVSTMWEDGSYEEVPVLVGGEPVPLDSGIASYRPRMGESNAPCISVCSITFECFNQETPLHYGKV